MVPVALIFEVLKTTIFAIFVVIEITIFGIFWHFLTIIGNVHPWDVMVID